jgi:hypothetical protein
VTLSGAACIPFAGNIWRPISADNPWRLEILRAAEYFQAPDVASGWDKLDILLDTSPQQKRWSVTSATFTAWTARRRADLIGIKQATNPPR